jgi:hypothetical protein
VFLVPRVLLEVTVPLDLKGHKEFLVLRVLKVHFQLEHNPVR